MKSLSVLAIAVLVCGFPGSARADDLTPAPYRGSPLSVEAHWDFISSPNFNGEPPDTFNTVGGSGNETLYNGFNTHIDFGGTWSWDGVSSITPTDQLEGGSLGINIQNWVDLEPLKLLRFQVTYSGLMPTTIGVTAQELAGTVGEYGVIGSLVQHVDIDANNFYEDWQIVPNPDWEQIGLAVEYGTSIDQIDIDTISIPEPSTLVLGGLGVVGFMIMSWKRRQRP